MPALATGAGHEPGLYELLAALPSQLQPHVSCPEDNTFLQDMFGERSLHSLIKIHERLQHYEESKPVPVQDNAASLGNEMSEELEGKSANGEIKELLQILAKPHVKSLLSVHDSVAQKSYDPELPPLPEDIDDDEDSVKIIRLVKNKEPLIDVYALKAIHRSLDGLGCSVLEAQQEDGASCSKTYGQVGALLVLTGFTVSCCVCAYITRVDCPLFNIVAWTLITFMYLLFLQSQFFFNHYYDVYLP